MLRMSLFAMFVMCMGTLTIAASVLPVPVEVAQVSSFD